MSNSVGRLFEQRKIGNWILSLSIAVSLIYSALRFLSSDRLNLNWDSPIFIDGAYRVF